jgi:hypothetical protein
MASGLRVEWQLSSVVARLFAGEAIPAPTSAWDSIAINWDSKATNWEVTA